MSLKEVWFWAEGGHWLNNMQEDAMEDARKRATADENGFGEI